MGRTARNRLKRHEVDRSRNISENALVVLMLKWMKRNGWESTCPLRLSQFPLTGRGLMARKKINAGDVLVRIPASLLITTATVSCSVGGHILLNLLSQKESRLSSQQLLAYFLVWEKHLGEVSSWKDYIKTLPTLFSTPHFLKEEEVNMLPEFLCDTVVASKEQAHKSWLNLLSYTKTYHCDHCNLSASDIICWGQFLWGWCCVNTRAVYIEPKFVPTHKLLVEDRDCLALAPYLDMLNHSDVAEVKASFNSKSSCYELRTLTPIKKSQEVFINYGPHSNIKLYTEYGFVIPSNKHDSVPILYSDFIAAFTSAGVCLLYEFEKRKLVEQWGILTNLFISCDGLSWNCVITLRILLCKAKNSQLWKTIAFADNERFVWSNLEFCKVVNCLYYRITENLLKSVRKLQRDDAPEIGVRNNCVHMCEMLLSELVSVVRAAQNLNVYCKEH